MSNVLSPVFNNGNLIIENIIPVATNDSYTTEEDQKLDIDINSGTLSNDTDANGDDLTAILVTDVSNGTLSFNSVVLSLIPLMQTITVATLLPTRLTMV